MQRGKQGRVLSFEGVSRKTGIRSLVSQVPEQIKGYLSHSADGGTVAVTAGTRHERIVWAAFEETDVFGPRRLCLVLVYVAGFQIWDVTDAARAAEVISVRDINADVVRFIPEPRDLSRHGSLAGVWPAIAIGYSAAHHQAELRVFSMVSLSTVEVVTLSSELTQLLCNDTVIVVGCTNEVLVYSSATLHLLSRNRCFAHVRPCSPFALGSRFLAFAGSLKLPSAMESQLGLADFAADALATSRRVTADLWEFGRQKVADLVAPSAVSAEIARQRMAAAAEQEVFADAETDELCAGTVVVKDIGSGRVVAHFRAHRHAISTLAFDGAGWLLLTSSVEGHKVNVFRLNLPGIRGRLVRPTHIYKLRRGFTSALIYNALFSHDVAWIAASSVNGTTHVYSLSAASPGRVVQYSSSEYQRTAASRIRDFNRSASSHRDGDATAEQQSSPALPAVAFADEDGEKARLLVCSSTGTVTVHEVVSHTPVSGGAAASCPVSVEGVRAVNLRRDIDLQSDNRSTESKSYKRAQNPFEVVEMTSSVDKGPLWALNQFVFLAMERPGDEIPVVSAGLQPFRRAFDDPYPSAAEFAVLELRRSEPLPLSSSAARLGPVVSGFDAPRTVPSSDEEIRAQMDEALSTEFEIPWLLRDYPNLATDMDSEGPAVIDTADETGVQSLEEGR